MGTLRVSVLDHGYVGLKDSWGSDENIIRAARQSTNKGFLGWDTDKKLLKYLWTHEHLTPFEMAGAIFEVQAPIFVLRQWHRHRWQSYNEMSARYVELPNLDYIPSLERLKTGGQSKVNKQGSGENISSELAHAARERMRYSYKMAQHDYECLLESGVARELARLVLPTARYSRMWAQANLRSWLHFISLRSDEHAQWEIRQYSDAIYRMLTGIFPRTCGVFAEGRQG